MIKRVFLVVLDSLGVGELPDADEYGDQGSNTLGNMAQAMGGLALPNFQKWGLGNIIPVAGVPPQTDCLGCYGKMGERSKGKDTTTGHWEMMGVILPEPFPVFPNGFPESVIQAFEHSIGREVLGNKVASGTVIIEELGPEHMETGKPIVYTSADSVFQIAAHEEIIPVEQLYDMCEKARALLTGPNGVGRVIARPFAGSPGSFERTERRHDYSIEPISATVLDSLVKAGIPVTGIGKIQDIFAGRGISASHHTGGNTEGLKTIQKLMKETPNGLVFANLVDFDMRYGHRNDVQGYADALREVDDWLPVFQANLLPEDVMIFTADHGCDPTTESTDHSREYVPLLLYGPALRQGVNLGIRDSMSDLGQTIAALLQVTAPTPGRSFAELIMNR